MNSHYQVIGSSLVHATWYAANELLPDFHHNQTEAERAGLDLTLPEL